MALREQLAEIFANGPGPSPFDISFDTAVDAVEIRRYVASVLGNSSRAALARYSLGREGPEVVNFDRETSRGGALFEGPGGLRLEGQGSFASARADAGVSKGAWFFEVELLTSGIMQVGWCTAATPFTDDEGAHLQLSVGSSDCCAPRASRLRPPRRRAHISLDRTSLPRRRRRRSRLLRL